MNSNPKSNPPKLASNLFSSIRTRFEERF